VFPDHYAPFVATSGTDKPLGNTGLVKRNVGPYVMWVNVSAGRPVYFDHNLSGRAWAKVEQERKLMEAFKKAGYAGRLLRLFLGQDASGSLVTQISSTAFDDGLTVVVARDSLLLAGRNLRGTSLHISAINLHATIGDAGLGLNLPLDRLLTKERMAKYRLHWNASSGSRTGGKLTVTVMDAPLSRASYILAARINRECGIASVFTNFQPLSGPVADVLRSIQGSAAFRDFCEVTGVPVSLLDADTLIDRLDLTQFPNLRCEFGDCAVDVKIVGDFPEKRVQGGTLKALLLECRAR